jgi:hypothetical protein
VTFPILTLPDPLTTGEGALDPLGLATLGDRLAEQILPGLRARMHRPRFLTAMAVCAQVCQDIEDKIAADQATPAHIVFEWLLVEGFVRAADRSDTIGTPGVLKAQAVRDSGEPMRASSYLRTPGVFGYHGVYKPLARHLGIVDDDMRLGDTGYALLKDWQLEQGLPGFLPAASGNGAGRTVCDALRSAVEDALGKGCTTRSSQWKGWTLLASHLAPAKIGDAESAVIHRLLLDPRAGTRGEVFRILEQNLTPDEMPEAGVIQDVLIPRASAELKATLHAIAAYETACTFLEAAFEWIQYLSSKAGARAITGGDFGSIVDVQRISQSLPEALRRAEDAVAPISWLVQKELAQTVKAFDSIKTPGDLFEGILSRHHDIQQAKKPDGKRDWFERAPDGSTFVRVPYRVTKEPEASDHWNRPYRVNTVRSFLSDLTVGAYEPA